MIRKLLGNKKRAPHERRDAQISQRARQHLERLRRRERKRLHGRDTRKPRSTAGPARDRIPMGWIAAFVVSLMGGIYLAQPLEPLLLQWAPAQFEKLESIAIQGNSQLSFKDVALATGVARGESLADIDLQTVEARLRAQPWIKNAQVLRLPPAALVVRIEERSPKAVLIELTAKNQPRRKRLVDESGVVFASASGQEFLPQLIDGSHMQKVLDPEMLTDGLQLLEQLRKADIQALTPQGGPLAIQIPLPGSSEGWIIRGRIDVVMGRGQLHQRINRLALLLQNNEVRQLLSEDEIHIDLRFAEQAVLKRTGEEAST